MAFETSLRVGVTSQQAEANAKRAATAIRSIKPAAAGTDKAVKTMNRTVDRSSGSFDRMRKGLIGVKGLLGAAGIGIGIGAFVGGMRSATAAATAFESSLAQIGALLETTGGASGRTVAQIERLARAIGAETLGSAKEVRTAAAGLLTFKSIAGDVFDRTLRAAQDLSSLGFGSLSSASLQLAKALEDPALGLTMLRRVGVSFDAQQQKLIKTLAKSGRAFEAQSEILKVVEAQVGGAAAGAATGTTAGAFDRLGESVDRLLEQAGRSDSLRTLADGIAAVFEALNRGVAPVEFLNIDDLLKRAARQQEIIGATQGTLLTREEQARLAVRKADVAAIEGELISRDLLDFGERTAFPKAAIEFTEKQVEAVRKITEALAFEADQLGRTAEQQKIYNLLKRAGVTAESELGEQIVAGAQALEAERAAMAATTKVEDQANKARQQTVELLDRIGAKIKERLAARTKAEAAAGKFIDRLEEQNRVLRAEAAGRDDIVQILKFEARERAALAQLGPDATELQIDATTRLVAEQQQLNDVIAEQDRLRQRAEEAADEWSRICTTAAEDIQRALADGFERALRGGIASFRDMADAFRDFMTRAIADVVSAMVFRPVIQTLIAPIAAQASQLFGQPVPAQFAGAAGVGGIGGTDALSLAGSAFAQRNFTTFGGLSNFETLGRSIGGIFGAGGSGAGSFVTGGVGSIGASPAFAGGGLSPALASALGIGAAVGLPFITSLLFGGDIGTAALSGIGGGLGFAVGGPIGAAVGGFLGSFLGGLFGSNKPPKTSSRISLLGPEELGVLTVEGKRGGNEAATRDLNTDLIKVLDELRISLGANFRTDSPLVRDGQQFIGGINTRGDEVRVNRILFGTLDEVNRAGQEEFDDVESAVAFFLEKFAEQGGFTDLPGRINEIIKTEGIEVALQGVEFLKGIERSIRQLDAPLELALDDLSNKFNQIAEDAAKFGADLADVERLAQRERLAIILAASDQQIEALQASFTTIPEGGGVLGGVLGAVLNTVGGGPSAQEQLQLEFAIATRTAVQEIDKALIELASTVTAFEGLDERIGTFVKDLRLSDLSPLSTADKLGEARGRFAALIRQSERGDAGALAQVEQAATDFLQLSQAFNASSVAFANDFNAVTMALEALGASSPDIVDAATEQITILGEIKKGLLDPGGPLAEKLAEQTAALEAINATSGGGFTDVITALYEQNDLAVRLATETANRNVQPTGGTEPPGDPTIDAVNANQAQIDQLNALGQSLKLNQEALGTMDNEGAMEQLRRQIRDLDGIPGFRHGGALTVPGSGGPDSQLVRFRATPGENVRVFPAGGDPAIAELTAEVRAQGVRMAEIEQRQVELLEMIKMGMDLWAEQQGKDWREQSVQLDDIRRGLQDRGERAA